MINPDFNSQTKEYMTSNKEKNSVVNVKSVISLYQIFRQKIGIVEEAIELTEMKDSKSQEKTMMVRNKTELKVFPKLEDAIWVEKK